MALSPRGMPIPPEPVMPPEGLAPITQEVGLGAGDDAMSPTTMVLNYLKARGYTPSSENVRRALEANQRDPGVITGLRSDRAATEEEDQAAMAASRGGSAGNTSAAPPSATPPSSAGSSGTFGPGQSPVEPGPLPTSATPGGASAAPAGFSLVNSIINGLPLAAAGGAGAYALNRYYQNNRAPDPVIDLPGGGQMPPAMGPGAAGKYVGPQFGPPQAPPINPATLVPPAPAANPMEAALNKAVPPEAPPIQPMRPAKPGGSGGAQDVIDEAAIAAGKKPAPKPPFGSTSPRGAPTTPLPVVRPGAGTVLRGILQHARP